MSKQTKMYEDVPSLTISVDLVFNLKAFLLHLDGIWVLALSFVYFADSFTHQRWTKASYKNDVSYVA